MRKTIADLTHGVYDYSGHASLSDRQARRYHPFSFDFDSTPLSLAHPEEHWDEPVKLRHLEVRAEQIKRLELQYGTLNIEEVVKNATDLGPKSMSLLTYIIVCTSRPAAPLLEAHITRLWLQPVH